MPASFGKIYIARGEMFQLIYKRLRAEGFTRRYSFRIALKLMQPVEVTATADLDGKITAKVAD